MLTHRKAVLLFGDICVLSISFCLMVFIRFDVGAQGNNIWTQLQLFGLLFIFWLITFFICDLYNLRRINPNPHNIGLIILAMTINTVLAVLLFYITPSSGISPKTNLVILSSSTLILMVIWRRIFYLLFTKHFLRRILIIGENPLISNLVTELKKHKHIGNIIGHWPSINLHTPTTEADLLITEDVEPQALLALSQTLNTETLSLTEAYETIFGKLPVKLMTNEKALGIMTNRSSPAKRVLYRFGEVIFASLILISTSPLLLIAIIALYLEDGSPIFYSQQRVGKHGKPFLLYKLRSMKKDAEKNGAQWATEKDIRITVIGSIIRKIHIDEIPQMYNIIKGDLALIGPRPERPEFVATLEQEIPYYYLRHTIRPGFTGWAQIKFRYAATVLDSQEKFEYDLYYLKNNHTLLDVGIILKTIQIIFTH